MGGTHLAVPDWPSIGLILGETDIGRSLQLRLAALALVALLSPRPALLALPASIALATLAWSGHAAVTEGGLGMIHRVWEIAHMLAAGIWLAALLRFLRGMLRPSTDHSIALALTRFAWPGTIIVTILVATGLFNLAKITGFAPFRASGLSPYALLLGGKLLLFSAMLGLAATNR